MPEQVPECGLGCDQGAKVRGAASQYSRQCTKPTVGVDSVKNNMSKGVSFRGRVTAAMYSSVF